MIDENRMRTTEVVLSPITDANVGRVFDLKVAPGQERFVASNPWSLAQALAEYEIAWPRAIEVGGEVVGFLMLEIDPNEENGRPFWLWRLMLAAEHQRQGYGRRALELACEEVRARGGTEIYTSWLEGEGSPELFYLVFGFEPTGEYDDDERVARLRL
jgi:diamine N-acetyltransferase